MKRRYLNLVLIVVACGLIAGLAFIFASKRPSTEKLDPARQAVLATPSATSQVAAETTPTAAETATAKHKVQTLMNLVDPGDRIQGFQGWQSDTLSVGLVWKVHTEKKRQVWVDRRGTVVFFFDAEKLKKQPAGTLSRHDALLAAREEASALGLDLPSLPPTNRKLRTAPESPAPRSWDIRWYRYYKGFRYHDDVIWLEVVGMTGAVRVYSIGGRQLEPETLEVRVTAARAADVAGIVVGPRSGVQAKKAELMIVRPDYYWSDTPTPSPGGYTRLAWVIPFAATDIDSGEVWVDAETGKCIGGVRCQ